MHLTHCGNQRFRPAIWFLSSVIPPELVMGLFPYMDADYIFNWWSMGKWEAANSELRLQGTRLSTTDWNMIAWQVHHNASDSTLQSCLYVNENGMCVKDKVQGADIQSCSRHTGWMRGCRHWAADRRGRGPDLNGSCRCSRTCPSGGTRGCKAL